MHKLYTECPNNDLYSLTIGYYGYCGNITISVLAKKYEAQKHI